jgi:hypothetical protein
MNHSNSPPTGSAPDFKDTRRRWGRAQGDHILDSYKQPAKMHEPVVCPQCHAVYHQGRWQWMDNPPEGANEHTCQACHRINDRYPAGILTLEGPFVAAHKDEMISLAHNQEKAEKPEHPLNRIMSIEEEAPDRLVISTTDIHLPRRIGVAIARAYHGTLSEHFDEGGYFMRMNWHRAE